MNPEKLVAVEVWLPLDLIKAIEQLRPGGNLSKLTAQALQTLVDELEEERYQQLLNSISRKAARQILKENPY